MIIYKYGITIEYKCIYLRKPFERKCKDRETDKCLKCKYGMAEMSAKDATKLLDWYVSKG